MKKIMEFNVLYSGWELDDKGWIVEDEKGDRHIMLTNHGQEYIAQPDELCEKIREYARTIEQTAKALELLNVGK